MRIKVSDPIGNVILWDDIEGDKDYNFVNQSAIGGVVIGRIEIMEVDETLIHWRSAHDAVQD